MSKYWPRTETLAGLLLGLTVNLPLSASDWPPPSMQAVPEGPSLDLVGSSRYVYLRLFPLYQAALYTSGDPTALTRGEAPGCLALRYLRDIDREDLIRAAEAVLEREAALDGELASAVDALHQRYRDVREGDRYTLCLSGDGRTLLHHNDELAAEFDTPGLGPRYLGIWLGEQPLSAGLRDELLGRD